MAVNFAAASARIGQKPSARDPRADLKRAASTWRASHKEQRENELKQIGVVIPLSPWLGHNNGPDILDPNPFLQRHWRAARKAAFAPPDLETGARWARKAEILGLSYEEYRLELLERGRYPTEEEAKDIRARRAR